MLISNRFILFLTILFGLFSFAIDAQAPKSLNNDSAFSFDLRADRQTTSGGHLNFSALGPGITYGKHSLHIGALIQDKTWKIKGFTGNYQYFPTALSEHFYPYFQYAFIGRWNSRLIPEFQGLLHNDDHNSKKFEKYRTFEHYLGFGIRAFVILDFYIDVGIGLGLYSSELQSDFDNRRKNHERFRRKRDASLNSRASLGYHF